MRTHVHSYSKNGGEPEHLGHWSVVVVYSSRTGAFGGVLQDLW